MKDKLQKLIKKLKHRKTNINENSWPIVNITNKIIPEEIDYLEYIEKTYFYHNEPPIRTYTVKCFNSGKMTTSEETKHGNDITEKKITSETMLDFCNQVSNFLTSGPLKKVTFIDDSEGSLFIHYKDGHIEEYDRGLSKGILDTLDDLIASFIRGYKIVIDKNMAKLLGIK